MRVSKSLARGAWAGAGLSLALACVASSAGNPVADREAAMKQLGAAMKDSAGYASGQTAYDPAKVKATMAGVAANARKLQGLFPAGSAADAKTSADPKIWQNKADFDKRLAELAKAATAAGKAPDAAAFKTALQPVGASCKSCHDIYRKKKS